MHGQLKQCRSEANNGYRKFLNSNPQWALRFRILEARAVLEQGHFDEALGIAEDRPVGVDSPELAVSAIAVAAVARIHMGRLPEADLILKQALQQCHVPEVASCGELLQALAILADERSDSPSAQELYTRALLFARSHNDPFLESNSLLNLGNESITQGRFDEAINLSEAASRSSKRIDARVIALVAQGNIGWACYRLGDAEKALSLSLDSEKTATELDDVFDQENLLTNIGYIYMDQRRFDLAAQSFEKALEIAKGIKAKQDVYNALRVLARLALQTGDPSRANDYAEQALVIAGDTGRHVDELFPLLVQGQIAAIRGDSAKARQIFQQAEHDPASPAFLKWEAQHALAQLDEGANHPDEADREYRAALATFESARSTVHGENFQLSFLTNAARIYDDYVHFLVGQGKPEEALRWADYSRARTLAEGFATTRGSSDIERGGPPALNLRELSRRAGSTLLFYWLGEKQSYLWAITPQKTNLFPLPPGADIESMVLRYRSALKGPDDVLQSSEDARALYRTLIGPAKALLPTDAKVLIIPDGSLNNLNFETLIVPEPKPHFWIDDADVANASSLRVLSASLRTRSAREQKRSHRLLLIGNSVAPRPEYPELRGAARQMGTVARHFPVAQEQVYQRDQATPAAYLASNPETFSHIHFVAHGTASRLSPLDSAIVLSQNPAETDSFKLYARDIVQHRLHADLVTISACYSAGERAYVGEGLVGLAWAFLRAGAHNVIAGLWEVTDASTEVLMDRFYDELDRGATPDAALRAAKLSLLHGNQYHNPFYWAPLQLYTGS